MGNTATSGLAKAGAYLAEAEEALREIGRPATIEEIRDQILEKKPGILKGKTPYKTIQARISSSIKKYGADSPFFRTGPATFGLYELVEQPNYRRGTKIFYHGFDRSRQLDKSERLAIRKSSTSFRPSVGFTDSYIFPLRTLKHLPTTVVSPADKSFDEYFIISLFVIVRHYDSVIAFMPSEYDKNYKKVIDKEIIGINGIIKSDDRNLFDQNNYGYYSAVNREYINFYRGINSTAEKSIEGITFHGFVYEDYSKKRENMIGLVSVVDVNEKFEVDGHRLGARNIGWRSLSYLPNSLPNFEPWSYFTFLHLHELVDGK